MHEKYFYFINVIPRLTSDKKREKEKSNEKSVMLRIRATQG